jgi:hypothetical protein
MVKPRLSISWVINKLSFLHFSLSWFIHATDTMYPHIKFWWYRTMLNFYPHFYNRNYSAILATLQITSYALGV